jgi:glycosyltransferase involved in cell wall biosynthesis
MDTKNMMEFAGKRILIIVENLCVPFDRRVWQEARALKEKGAIVSVICPKSQKSKNNYENLEGINIFRHSLPIEARGFFGYLLEYTIALFSEIILSIKVFFKVGFDVIHACNPPDDIFLIGMFYKILGKKFLFDHHDLCPELFFSKFAKKGFLYKFMILFEKLTFKYADISIATNNSYKEIAIKRGGMNPDNVYIVRSAPDIQKFEGIRYNKKHKKGKKYLIGYLGVIGVQEGLKYLVEACSYIKKTLDRDDVHFVCVGDGTELPNIKNYAHELNVYDDFTFTGRVSDELLMEIINTSDVCVNPDEYNELNDNSTMNKIIEYMALGKPIVQFDLKEGRFSAGESSLYARNNDPIDFANKIVFLLDNQNIRKNMGEYGFKRFKEELNWSIQKEELYKAYNRLFS